MDSICGTCKGGFRCTNENSPCFGYFCGEYPGTGITTVNVVKAENIPLDDEWMQEDEWDEIYRKGNKKIMEKYCDKNYVKKIVKENCSVEFFAEQYSKFITGFSCQPDVDKFPKYKTGDVIDEDKSVRWNREEVEKRKQAREEEVKRLNKEKNELYKLYDDGLLKLLIEEYRSDCKMKKEEARILYNKAYSDEHSSGVYSVVEEFRELADMYGELLKARK